LFLPILLPARIFVLLYAILELTFGVTGTQAGTDRLSYHYFVAAHAFFGERSKAGACKRNCTQRFV
jgi:hypothetical protein